VLSHGHHAVNTAAPDDFRARLIAARQRLGLTRRQMEDTQSIF